jgi:O-antigen/teichoic acid export membrane protein
MNLTLVINCTAAITLTAAAVLVPDFPLSAVGLAYTSGLLTALASRYDISVRR